MKIIEFKVYLSQISHLQNNTENSNYTRTCVNSNHLLVVICILLHKSTIQDVAPYWEHKTGSESVPFLPGIVETTSRLSVLSAGSPSGVYLQF